MKNADKNVYLNLRVPKEVKEWLLEEAKKNYRTASKEAVMRIEESKQRQENATA